MKNAIMIRMTKPISIAKLPDKSESDTYYRRLMEESAKAECQAILDTIAIGSGWEIFALHNGKIPKPNSNEDAVVTFHVDITDEAKSTLFALKWIN